MTIRTAFTQHSDVGAAVEDLRAQLAGTSPRLILYFASSRYDVAALAAAMEAGFAPAIVLGCTTAGEQVTGRMLEGAVVAMALPAEVVSDVCVQVLSGLRDDEAPVSQAIAGFERHFGRPMRELDPSRYVGLVLIDGLSGSEERVMDGLGNLADILFVGGGAGDDLGFRATHVFAGGKALSDAAVLAVLRVERGYEVLKTQSFTAQERKLTVTRARPGTREVVEFDGKPAATAYAEAMGVPLADLEKAWNAHPLGLMVGAEPFVRSPQRVLPDGSIRFYCAMSEGMELSLLSGTDIVRDTRAALDARLQAGSASALVSFNCILRRLELDAKDQSAAYGQLFSSVPTVGFATYGEEYYGHINQTATMLLLR